MTRESRILNEERRISSTNSFEKAGQPHAKECNWSPTSRSSKKKKWIHKDLNAKTETLKHLEENTRGNLFNMGLGNDFFNMTPKALATKAKIKSGTSSSWKVFAQKKEQLKNVPLWHMDYFELKAIKKYIYILPFP